MKVKYASINISYSKTIEIRSVLMYLAWYTNTFQIDNSKFQLFIFKTASFQTYHKYPYSRIRRRQNSFKSKNCNRLQCVSN